MVLNESQLVNIPLGVDLQLFHPSQAEKPMTVFQEVPENFVFACTRLSKEKDPLCLLDIARELKARSSELTLVIAGSGPYEKRMNEVVLQENLPVILLGFVNDKEIVARLMAKAQVFLAVGPIETFGLAALESLASGTPVVCRKEAAISEIITSLCGAALHKIQSYGLMQSNTSHSWISPNAASLHAIVRRSFLGQILHINFSPYTNWR
jgi:alpha-1,6-mannosyltransferase